MKLGFIYAGQGTQYVGMGQSFYENDEDCKNLLDSVKLDFDLKDIMFNSDEKTISTTRFTQPAMVAVANMATLLLKKKGITPDYVCGLSLGEYSALSASGVFDPKTAIQVVRERGLAMEKAAEGVESAMMAILGLEREPLLDICVGCDGYVSIANYNCPGQLVIAGEKKAVEEAGAFAVVLECVPEKLARKVTEAIHIPTIGIGAGAGCDGQILVYADMLSMFSDFSPKFVRSFANVGEIMSQAFKDYDAAVKDSSFPAQEHTFKIADEVLDKLY